MAKDVSDTLRDALGHVVRDAVKNLGDATPHKKAGPLSGVRGVAAGAGLAALAPLAKKGVDAVRGNGLSAPKPGKLAGKAASRAGEGAGSKLKDLAGEKIDEAGGAGGLVKEAAGGLLPGIGDGGGSGGGMPGVGKGRRMPVQQAVDVAVPIETAYNQFTQFEDWPEFMHRVTRVTQEDDCTLNFATKIWGKTKEFTATIETQRPDERIKWRVSQGITHSGVVTFHELAPRLTRIEVSLDVDPGSLIEKAARGMRHVKRAVRADLHRYKAFIEMQELETGAWRGVIEDGELVDEHDESYDEERDYSDIDEIKEEAEASGEDEDQDEDEDEQRNGGGDEERRQRFKRQAESSGSRGRSRSKADSPPTPRPRSRPARSRSREETSSSRSGGSSSSRSGGSSSSRSGGSSSSRSGGSSKSSRRKAASKS